MRNAKRAALVGLGLTAAATVSQQASAFDQNRFLEAYSARVALLIEHDGAGDPAVKFVEYAAVGPYGGNSQPVYAVPEGHDVSFDCRMLVDARPGMTAGKAPKDVWKLLYSVRIEPDPAQQYYQIVDPADVFGNAGHHAKRAVHFLKWHATRPGDHQVVCEVTDPPGLSTERAILRVVPLPKAGGVGANANITSTLPQGSVATAPEQKAPGSSVVKMPGLALVPRAPGPADLIITAAALKLAPRCAPHQPVLIATVTVRNAGGQEAPVKSGVGMVQARDTAIADWGNGAGMPALAPGKSTQVSFPIYYLNADPKAMSGQHAFTFTVNGGHWLNESNTDNNSFGPVSVVVPAGFCAMR